MGTKQTLWLVGAAVMAMWPSVGEACSQPRGQCGGASLPGPLTNRPTNACALIPPATPGAFDAWDAGPPDGGVPAASVAFAFVGPDGARIYLVPGELWCPERELEPRTEYAFVGPALIGGCPVGDEQEFARFTTGDGPDVTRPPTPESPTVLACSSGSCDNSGCCGPYTAVTATASWGLVEDESGVVFYTDGTGLRTQPHYRWFSETSGHVMFEQSELFGLGRRRAPGAVRAIDIAGNSSAWSPLLATCDGPVAGGDVGIFDAGFPPDTRFPLDTALDSSLIPTRASGGGCSASANNTGLFGSLAVALALLLSRRRSRL